MTRLSPGETTCPAALIEAAIPVIAARAPALDAGRAFPYEDIALLEACGALRAPFPRAFGGAGWGTEPAGQESLLRALRALGHGNLSVGRLYEAHVNSIRLIARRASPALVRRAAEEAAEGALFGLWVTDPPPTHGTALALSDGVLAGTKMFCSGAGFVRRAVVTAHTEEGVRLLYASAENAEVRPLPSSLTGMRAACTGQVSFDGLAESEAHPFGVAGDYLAEPDFSAGAWRTTAVTAGGVSALVDEAMRQIAARGHAGSAQQLDRLGRAYIAAETAGLWAERAGRLAESAEAAANASAIVAGVGFARIGVETAALEAITLVERSLGLAAFAIGNPIERIARDLRTYLRQPAPDAVLAEAAAYRIGALT